MNRSVLLVLFLFLASCTKLDFVVEEIQFSFGKNNAQPNLVSNGDKFNPFLDFIRRRTRGNIILQPI